MIDRRRLLGAFAAAGGLGLAGCTSRGGTRPAAQASAPPLAATDPARSLAPLRASDGRVANITVGLRPFRPAGPRLDVEQVGDTRVVHNYGHGGSGWSLSWGSGDIAVRKALASSPDRVAVVGCGALGLTSALLAQSAGRRVTIYARDLVRETTSMAASGSWSPDSRVASNDAVASDFPPLWEGMARTSMRTFQTYVGLPGDPVRWIDQYTLIEPGTPARRPAETDPKFVDYASRIRDITPANEFLPSAETPFRVPVVRRNRNLLFNIGTYADLLMSRFVAGGGIVQRREFREPGEFARLPEKVVINCTGYGARALWRDETLIPVRGQITHLLPQAEFDYGLRYRRITVLPRSDGILVQVGSSADARGYGEDSLAADPAESEAALKTLAELYSSFTPTSKDRGRPSAE